MGFRNPITSAEEVDTANGVPSSPGVKVYNKPGNPAIATVEWATGTMDPGGNATAQLTGGGSGGSSFTLAGGATELVAAPSLSLNVEPLAGGSYGAKARLSQAVELIHGPDALILTAVNGGRWGAYGAGWAGPYAYLTAAGEVVVEGMLKSGGAGNWGAGQAVAQLPSSVYYPAKTRTFNLIGANNRGWRCDVGTDGILRWQSAMASDTSYAVGDYFSLEGIRFFPALPA